MKKHGVLATVRQLLEKAKDEAGVVFECRWQSQAFTESVMTIIYCLQTYHEMASAFGAKERTPAAMVMKKNGDIEGNFSSEYILGKVAQGLNERVKATYEWDSSQRKGMLRLPFQCQAYELLKILEGVQEQFRNSAEQLKTKKRSIPLERIEAVSVEKEELARLMHEMLQAILRLDPRHMKTSRKTCTLVAKDEGTRHAIEMPAALFRAAIGREVGAGHSGGRGAR